MKIVITIIALLTLTTIWAQQSKDSLNTEVVNVVKPYTAKISDAFKIKDKPKLQNETIKKQSVNYQINSVPVASTFTPSKGKAKALKRPKRERLYDNYLSLGFGNYTTPLIEAYIRAIPNRESEFGVLLKHHSSQGGIKSVLLDDSFYDSAVDLYYKRATRDLNWKLNLDAQHKLYHWYGLPTEITDLTFLDTISAKQSYFNIGLGGDVHFHDGNLKEISIVINRLGDAYKSSEVRARLQPVFEFPISSELLNIKLDLDFLNGNFERDYANTGNITYSNIKFGVLPTFEVLRDYFGLKLGVKLYYAIGKGNPGQFKAYPDVSVSYQVIDEIFTVYAGVTGGLHYNTYLNISNENPFISPNFISTPTDQRYSAFTGLKGKIANNISYLLKASYTDERDKALFILNRVKTENGGAAVNADYELGNSFGVVYDNIKTLGIQGELAIDFSNEFTFGGRVDYNAYTMKNHLEAWNLPNLKATLFTDYHSGKWTGDAKLFVVGSRKDIELPYLGSFTTDYWSSESAYVLTNKAYIDLNAGISYAFTNKLSAFAKGHNLLGMKYNRFYNYKTQGLQVLAGITFKFDM